jgi:hypothetical protein
MAITGRGEGRWRGDGPLARQWPVGATTGLAKKKRQGLRPWRQ